MSEAPLARGRDIEGLLEVAELTVPKARLEPLAEELFYLAGAARIIAQVVAKRPETAPVVVFRPSSLCRDYHR